MEILDLYLRKENNWDIYESAIVPEFNRKYSLLIEIGRTHDYYYHEQCIYIESKLSTIICKYRLI